MKKGGCPGNTTHRDVCNNRHRFIIATGCATLSGIMLELVVSYVAFTAVLVIYGAQV